MKSNIRSNSSKSLGVYTKQAAKEYGHVNDTYSPASASENLKYAKAVFSALLIENNKNYCSNMHYILEKIVKDTVLNDLMYAEWGSRGMRYPYSPLGVPVFFAWGISYDASPKMWAQYLYTVIRERLNESPTNFYYAEDADNVWFIIKGIYVSIMYSILGKPAPSLQELSVPSTVDIRNAAYAVCTSIDLCNSTLEVAVIRYWFILASPQYVKQSSVPAVLDVNTLQLAETDPDMFFLAIAAWPYVNQLHIPDSFSYSDFMKHGYVNAGSYKVLTELNKYFLKVVGVLTRFCHAKGVIPSVIYSKCFVLWPQLLAELSSALSSVNNTLESCLHILLNPTYSKHVQQLLLDYELMEHLLLTSQGSGEYIREVQKLLKHFLPRNAWRDFIRFAEITHVLQPYIQYFLVESTVQPLSLNGKKYSMDTEPWVSIYYAFEHLLESFLDAHGAFAGIYSKGTDPNRKVEDYIIMRVRLELFNVESQQTAYIVAERQTTLANVIRRMPDVEIRRVLEDEYRDEQDFKTALVWMHDISAVVLVMLKLQLLSTPVQSIDKLPGYYELLANFYRYRAGSRGIDYSEARLQLPGESWEAAAQRLGKATGLGFSYTQYSMDLLNDIGDYWAGPVSVAWNNRLHTWYSTYWHKLNTPTQLQPSDIPVIITLYQELQQLQLLLSSSVNNSSITISGTMHELLNELITTSTAILKYAATVLDAVAMQKPDVLVKHIQKLPVGFRKLEPVSAAPIRGTPQNFPAGFKALPSPSRSGATSDMVLSQGFRRLPAISDQDIVKTVKELGLAFRKLGQLGYTDTPPTKAEMQQLAKGFKKLESTGELDLLKLTPMQLSVALRTIRDNKSRRPSKRGY